MKISYEYVPELTDAVALPTQQAWAAYVRQRWQRDCVANVMREWHLTEGRARGLVYGHATQSTIDLICAHPRGGIKVEIEVIALRYRMTADQLFQQYIERERGAIAHERRRVEAAEARMVALRRRLSDDGPLDTV